MAFSWNLRTKAGYGGEIWVNLKDVEIFVLKMKADGAPEAETRPLDHIVDAAYRSEGRRRV